jgi:hypothetical protein
MLSLQASDFGVDRETAVVLICELWDKVERV